MIYSSCKIRILKNYASGGPDGGNEDLMKTSYEDIIK